jgi:outer membrane biosynthesis protein TonB
MKLILVTSFETVSTKITSVETPTTPSSSINIEFSNDIIPKTEDKSVVNESLTTNFTLPITPVDEQQKIQENEPSTKPKSYRDAIAKKEKVTTNTTNENQSIPVAAAAAAATGPKATKSGKQKSSKSGGRNARSTRGHPQDVNDYYDDSWYYGTGEESYLHTGYTDDQEIFVGNLSAQVTEEEVKNKII